MKEADSRLHAYSSLVVLCGEKPPDEVTRELGVVPTKITLKGESFGKVVPSASKPRDSTSTRWLSPQNVWRLSSQGSVDDAVSLDAHLSWLLRGLSGKKSAIASLRDRGFELKVSCMWFDLGDVPVDPVIGKSLVNQFADLGLEVTVDVY